MKKENFYDFIERLENEAITFNGAKAYKSSKSGLVDLLAMGGASRNKSQKEIEEIINNAFEEDRDKAIKLLFYIRDCREGQGERQFFRTSMQILIKKYGIDIVPLISYIPEYGRWDDIFDLIGINSDVDIAIRTILLSSILEDIYSEYPSLLAKWFPSENAGKVARRKYKKVMNLLFSKSDDTFNAAFRRKFLSPCRRKLNIIEHNISKKSYENIDYEKVPSLAMKRYKDLFYKYDGERFENYLKEVLKGTKKINTSVLNPVDIVQDIFRLNNNSFSLSKEKENYYENLWKNLKEIRNNNENAIVVCDTSGSMYDVNYKSISTAIGLSIYIAERNKEAFKNKFITFSENPTLQTINGSNIIEKISNLRKAEWGVNTNIRKVFNLILQYYEEFNIKNSEELNTVYIISDMEFDYGTEERYDVSLFSSIKKMFNSKGYKMPHLVFWNVNSMQNQVPLTIKDDITLISGSSPVCLQYALNGAMSVVNQICENKRYEKIHF